MNAPRSLCITWVYASLSCSFVPNNVLYSLQVVIIGCVFSRSLFMYCDILSCDVQFMWVFIENYLVVPYWASAARSWLLKSDSISALSNWIFDIIGLARTYQEYQPKIPQNWQKLQFLHNSIKILFNISRIQPIFGDFVIRYRFSMLFDAGLSISHNWFWVHIRCEFDILKYRAAYWYDINMACLYTNLKMIRYDMTVSGVI